MQTFLPYPSYKQSAEILDYKRLGKQRLEGLSILYLCFRHHGRDLREGFTFSDKKADALWKQYQNHPAVLMWIDHELALSHYIHAICREWVNRGYKDRQQLNLNRLYKHGAFDNYMTDAVPFWFGDRLFHASHRSMLYKKDPEHYHMFADEPDLNYVWPVTKEDTL